MLVATDDRTLDPEFLLDDERSVWSKRHVVKGV